MNHSNGIGQDTPDSIIRIHYRCDDMMLLYPFVSGGKVGTQRVFGMADGLERLRVAQIDVSRHMGDVVDSDASCLVRIGISPQTATPRKKFLSRQ